MRSERVRELALAGVCFECGAGPFKSVTAHLSVKHGIDKFALCEAAGVTMETVFLSPEIRVKHRQNYKPEYLPNLHGGQGKKGPKRFTSAGKVVVATTGRLTASTRRLTATERSESARRAALARWHKPHATGGINA